MLNHNNSVKSTGLGDSHMDYIYDTEYYDPLTRLPNVAQFRILAQKLLDSRQMRSQGIAFVYFNVQNFKSFNHKYGIAAGDNLLQAIAQLIQTSFQGRIVARVAVDHFAVVAEKAGLEGKINDLCEDVHSFRRDTRLELKAGIYVVGDEIRDVNVALDRSKMAGDMIRNQYGIRYGYYDPDAEEQIQRERYITESLEDDLAGHRISVLYEPIIRVNTGEVCCVEARPMWIEEHLGRIYPDEFIPVLEKNNQASKLDFYILETVCREMVRLRNEGKTYVPVSVNFSASNFLLKDLPDRIENLITKYEISKGMFRFEIKQNAFGENYLHVRNVIDTLRSLGYEIWMDDFGNGFSSLNNLKDFELDGLKLSMKFQKKTGEDTKSQIILYSMIEMAKRLNIKTIALGVDTDAAYDFLMKCGCEMMQGQRIGDAASSAEILREYTLENPEERNYQNTLGSINLLRTGFIARNLDHGSPVREGLPMAIVEMQAGRIRYLRTNDAFLEFLKSVDVHSLEQSEDYLNRNVGEGHSLFIKMAQRCRLTGKPESLDYIDNGQYCNMKIRLIDYNKYRAAFLVICLNLSDITNLGDTASVDESMRSIYSLFERIDLFNEDWTEGRNIYLNSTILNTKMLEPDIRKMILNFGSRNIAKADELRYARFFDPKTMAERIREAGDKHITDFFRTKTEDGDYQWIMYLIAETTVNGQKRYISCASTLNLHAVSSLMQLRAEEAQNGGIND